MVDTRDLKSLGRIACESPSLSRGTKLADPPIGGEASNLLSGEAGRAGPSPAPGTKNFRGIYKINSSKLLKQA